MHVKNIGRTTDRPQERLHALGVPLVHRGQQGRHAVLVGDLGAMGEGGELLILPHFFYIIYS